MENSMKKLKIELSYNICLFLSRLFIMHAIKLYELFVYYRY